MRNMCSGTQQNKEPWGPQASYEGPWWSCWGLDMGREERSVKAWRGTGRGWTLRAGDTGRSRGFHEAPWPALWLPLMLRCPSLQLLSAFEDSIPPPGAPGPGGQRSPRLAEGLGTVPGPQSTAGIRPPLREAAPGYGRGSALGLGAPVWTYKAQSNLHQPSAQDAGPALPAASSSSSKQRLTRAWQPWAVLPYLPGPTSSLPGTVPALLPASGDLCQEKGEQ